ncbi:MAG: diphthine synthase [Methanobacteriota archaeon]
MIPREHPMTKGRLLFIGLGLHDENDITLKGLEEIKHCDTIYAEFYTSRLTNTAIPALEKKIKKKITILSRQDIENATALLDEAEKKTVALLIGGDPMMATTHIDLRLRARERGIVTNIIHNSSIMTAVPGLLGLQNYKFGRTTTLPFPEKNYFPTSPYTVIKDNTQMGLHTLVLLDIQAEKNQYMTAHEGLNLLLRMEQEKKEHILNEQRIVCVVARAGSADMILAADTISRLIKKQFGPPLHTLVVPGELHFMEIQALTSFAGLPEETAKKIQKL